MQKLISKYGLAAHLALVAVAPLFLSPETVMWLTGLAVCWFVMEPSRIGQETLHEARRRTLWTMVRDPLFWVLLGLVVFAAIRALNGGVVLAYDAETMQWSVATPKIEFLPGCVTGTGLVNVVAVLVLWVVVTVVRHALGRSGRHSFLLVSSVLSAAYSVVLIVLLANGHALAKGYLECSWETPSFLGSVFGVYFTSAIVALLVTFESRWFKAMPFAFLAVIGNGLGLFAFAPPLVQCFYLGAALLTFLYSFVYARLTFPSRGEFKFLVVFGLGIAVVVLAVAYVIDPAIVDTRLAPYLDGQFLTAEFMNLRAALAAVSLEIWKTSPWAGTGLGSFPIELGFHASKTAWETIPVLQKAPLNGYWFLLVERGTVGAFLLAVPTLLLFGYYVRRLVGGIARRMPHPSCWSGLLVVAAVFVETLFTTTILMPGVLVAIAACLAVSTKAFPKEK